MTRGIAPVLLAAQVRNTAAWALDAAEGHARAIAAAPDLAPIWQTEAGHLPYLRLMLAAHHTTVATFVPTDVDAHIRHHHWREIEDADVLRSAVSVVDETGGWPIRPVSARVIDVAGVGEVSGHAGEWLAVRAGAAGRALELGADDLVAAVEERIDAELDHEARAMEELVRAVRSSGPGRAVETDLDALRVAMTLAHNAGDLSRVVEDWPARGGRADALREKWVKLGHERGERHRGAFVLAGAINKRTTMADENHRYLPLRKARAVRRSRSLLLPIGPFFDGWGEVIATSAELTMEERAEIAGVLIEAHDAAPEKQGYLRALAGLAHRVPGGLDRLVAAHLPARARRIVAKGPIRDALRIDPAHFAARWSKRLRDTL